MFSFLAKYETAMKQYLESEKIFKLDVLFFDKYLNFKGTSTSSWATVPLNPCGSGAVEIMFQKVVYTVTRLTETKKK